MSMTMSPKSAELSHVVYRYVWYDNVWKCSMCILSRFL